MRNSASPASKKDKRKQASEGVSHRPDALAAHDLPNPTAAHHETPPRGQGDGADNTGKPLEKASLSPVSCIPKFGETLRRAREERGLSVHDLASLTRISVRWIVSLEADRFSELPASVFVIGYVRNLAQALSINSEELLSRFRAQRENQEAASKVGPHRTDRFENAMKQRRLLIWTVGVALVAVLSLLLLYLRKR
ncbi:MAG TPA: helix-turn-helix domain-containing protein [Pseudomonadota bacterium]|nr:helix-turn-helix domain-containing protein [Pseudomonadota bacterium]